MERCPSPELVRRYTGELLSGRKGEDAGDLDTAVDESEGDNETSLLTREDLNEMKEFVARGTTSLEVETPFAEGEKGWSASAESGSRRILTRPRYLRHRLVATKVVRYAGDPSGPDVGLGNME